MFWNINTDLRGGTNTKPLCNAVYCMRILMYCVRRHLQTSYHGHPCRQDRCPEIWKKCIREKLRLIKSRSSCPSVEWNALHSNEIDQHLKWNNNLLLCVQVRRLRGQKAAPRVTGGGSTNYPDLCLASPTSAEGDYLSSDEDLLPSPLPPNALYPTLSGPCHPSPQLDSEGSTDSEAEERVRTHPDPQQLYGSMVCAEALDNWDLHKAWRFHWITWTKKKTLELYRTGPLL